MHNAKCMMLSQAHTRCVFLTPSIRHVLQTLQNTRDHALAVLCFNNAHFSKLQISNFIVPWASGKQIHPRKHQLERVFYDLFQSCHIILTCNV